MRPPHEESIIGGRWTGKKNQQNKNGDCEAAGKCYVFITNF